VTASPSNRPRAVVAANAVPLDGGQGVNLFQILAGLAPSAALEVFAAGPRTGGTTHVVPRSRVASMISRVPVLRRARGRVAMTEDVHFDSWVARRLPPAEWFHALTGQCLKSLEAARALGMPTVLDVITAHVDEFVQEGLKECAVFRAPFAIHPRMRARMHEEYARADRIRVMSSYARRTFLARGVAPDRVIVVNPPMTVEQRPETRRPRKFCVGFVGTLEPWKGAHYLVDAFKRAAATDWTLRLVGGTGSRGVARYFREILRLDPRIVVAPADVRRAGVERAYGAFSVLVHPSVCDGFGQCVLEAMGCGVPVIVTDTTGASDLVRHGRTGYIVPPRDREAIAECLQRLAADPGLCEQMGREARAATLSDPADRFLHQYSTLLDSRVALGGDGEAG